MIRWLNERYGEGNEKIKKMKVRWRKKRNRYDELSVLT
jgi:hypothetical protein